MIGARLLQLSRDSLVYGFGSVLSSFVGIALVPILTRLFTPSEYGVIDLLVTVSSLAIAFLSFGFDSAAAILFFEVEREEEKVRVLSTAIWFIFVASSIVVLVLLPLSGLWSKLLFQKESYIGPVQLALAIIPFNLLLGFALNGLRFRFARTRYLLSVLIQVILTIALTVILLIPVQAGILGYFIAWFVSVAVTGAITLALAQRNLSTRFSGVVLRKLLVVGLPLIPAAIAGWSLSLIDRFFISRYSLHELGLYSLGVKLSSVLGLGIAALQLAWGPFALSLAKEPEAKQTYAKVLSLYTFVAGFLALLLTAYAPEIIKITSSGEFFGSARVVGWICLGLLAYGSYYIVSIGVAISKKTSHLAWTTAAAAILNIVLNFILIPPYGMVGAAIATLLSYVASAWLLYKVSQKYYPIPFESKKVALTWILLATFTLVFFLLPQEVQPKTFLLKTATVALFPLMLFSLRIVETGELTAVRNLFRSVLQRLKRQ
ncbi:MAG: oligosaccharide flippase family protein [Candidatus Kerfeldbacteria bacterium]|nr:oligosaccharide flippase family protein [Candidatus Kerfeldbacteria bacterium]